MSTFGACRRGFRSFDINDHIRSDESPKAVEQVPESVACGHYNSTYSGNWIGLGPRDIRLMTLGFVLSVMLGVAASCYMLLALRMLRGGSGLGSPAMGATFMVVGLWVLGGAIELVAISLPVFTVGRVAHFVGTSLVPVGILICFREITGNETPKAVIAALLIIPVLSIGIAATNLWHQFMWLYPAINADGEFLTRPLAWGPWFHFVHAPFSYLVVSASILTLLLHSSAIAPTHRRGLFLIIGTTIAPAIAVVLYDAGIGRYST